MVQVAWPAEKLLGQPCLAPAAGLMGQDAPCFFNNKNIWESQSQNLSQVPTADQWEV